MNKKIFCILAIILIIVCGISLYKNINNKKDNNNNHIVETEVIPEEETKEEEYSFELDSENKYIVITDTKTKTTLDDGGSYTSIYYEIDLDNSLINKVEEEYHANLGGTPQDEIEKIYTKKITSENQEKLKTVLNRMVTEEGNNKTEDYDYSYTINGVENRESKLFFSRRVLNKKLIDEFNTIIQKIEDTDTTIPDEEEETFREELSKEEKQILLEYSYSNYAWGYQFHGKVLFNDGTIYSWNINGNYGDAKNNRENYDVNTAEGLKEFVLDNGTKEENKVSKKELEKIENEISQLEDKIETEHAAYDAGDSIISAWKTNGEKIRLKISGDFEGQNTTDHAKTLIKIAEKYLK